MSSRQPDILSRLAEIEASATRRECFPDGTRLIEGRGTFDQIWQMMLRNRLVGEGGVWHPRSFGSLERLVKICVLWYTTEYRESLGELNLGIIFPNVGSNPTSACDRKNLLVTVGFCRKPSEEVSQSFIRCLGEFFRSVSRQGMFGEGPVRPRSSEVEFRGRVAQFRIDASNSGQDTLNWLLLCVINFGYSTSQVIDFVVDHEEGLESFIGRIGRTVIKVPLPEIEDT